MPKARYRILKAKVAELVENCIKGFSEQLGSEIIKLKVQKANHVHLLAMVQPKVSISGYVGTIGQNGVGGIEPVRDLKQKSYWGNHFWARGCVDAVGLDSEMIRKYVKYQEVKERESAQFKYCLCLKLGTTQLSPPQEAKATYPLPWVILIPAPQGSDIYF